MHSLSRRRFLQAAGAAAVALEPGRAVLRGASGSESASGPKLDDLLGPGRGGFFLLHFNGAEIQERPLSIRSRTSARVIVGLTPEETPQFTFRLDEHPSYLALHLEKAQGDFAARDTSLVFRGPPQANLEAFCLDYMGRNDSSSRQLQLTWPHLWNPHPADPLGAFGLIPGGLDDAARDRALAALWAEGTLPHPAIGEAWTIAAVERWIDGYHAKFAGLSETTLSASTSEELYKLSTWLAETGCRRVYLHTDTWRGEYWPRTRSFVAVNPRVFPRGRIDLVAYREFLKQKGMLLRLHNVSAGIGLQDPEFVPPLGIDSRLATWVNGHLEAPVGPETAEILFRPNPGYSFPHVRLAAHWNLKRFRLGAEVVEVAGIEDADRPVWRLRPVRRSVGGAPASAHPARTAMAGLLCTYGQNYLPDTQSSLLPEMAGRYATLINEAELDHQHYDGAEIHRHLEPWGFDKLSWHVAAQTRRATTTSTSGGRPTAWNFELHFSRIRKLPELGYWAAGIPVLLAGHRPASSWLDAHYEIASRLLRPARRLGFFKPEPMFGVTLEALEGHGLMPQFVDLFRAWNATIHAISDRETDWLRRHLRRVQSRLRQRGNHEESRDVPVLIKNENGYAWVPTRVMVRETLDAPWLTGQEFGPIGPRQYVVPGETVTLHNPYAAQPPQLILHLLPALQRHSGAALAATGAQPSDAALADYQTGTRQNASEDPAPAATGSPVESLWPAAAAVIPAGDTRLRFSDGHLQLSADNPTGQEIWEEQALPSWPCRVPLRGRRGLALEVVGDGSGAVLVLQLHGRGVRDYVVKLDFTGPRRVVIPHGEAAWSAACWGWRFDAKHFDYDATVTRVSLGFGCIPPHRTVRATVRHLALLENVAVPLRDPTVHLGDGVLHITGELAPHEYLTYEADTGVRVFDRNWRFLRPLASRAERWSVPTSQVDVRIESTAATPPPWLELQAITRGEPFPLSPATPTFNVKSFGATGLGLALDTAAIQRAIDACHAQAGGTVVVPAGTYLIGTLRLRSQVTLHLQSGAVLQGSQNLADYATEVQGAVEAPAFNRCLLYAENAVNLTLEGAGLIDGRGSRPAFPEKIGGQLAERPMLLRLVNCTQVKFTGLTFRHPASWCLHLVECRQVRFDGIAIESKNNHLNNDGIDLDSCRDVRIEHCRINSGDDAICLKSTTATPCSDVLVRNCDLSSHTAGVKLGTSSRAGFVNIKVTDTHFHDCPMGAIKLLLVDGGRMEHIELSRLIMENVGGPIFIRLGNRGRRYDRPTEQIYGAAVQPEGRPVGVIRGVAIRKLKAKISGKDLDRQGILITGIPGHCIEQVTLEDIDLRFAGPAHPTPVTREVPEDIARYPEQFFFGLLPSWGLFARHVDGLTLDNVRLDRVNPDVRAPFVFQDVRSLRVNRFLVNGAPATPPEAQSHD